MFSRFNKSQIIALFFELIRRLKTLELGKKLEKGVEGLEKWDKRE